MMDFAQNMQKCSEYVEALEVERRKIQVFQRELPLCFELVSQAIDACRQQLSSPAAVGTSHDCFNVRRQQQSECSEQTSRSGHGPILEEFIPIKKFESCSSEDGNGGGGGDEEEEDESGEKSGKKSDWLRSVQLWNQSPDPADPVPEVKKNGGAFSPFDKEKVGPKDIEVVGRRPVEDKPASSTTVKSRKEESSKVKDNGQTTQRKQRRCWSPELHRRFIHSLQQLGGPHVATPKQIKELMKVDGLTNDEVKSHLQKYRLHMRRPSATMASSSNTQGPQFLVVGGIWVPPSDCPAAGATAATMTSSADQGEPDSARKKDRTPSNGVYAPVATIGTPFARPALSIQNTSQKAHSRSHCEDDGSHSAHGGARGRCSSSPTSSSSTHTTAVATASPGSS